MTDDARLAELLEEALDSGLTPEEVCTQCPDLAPELRRRLERCRAVDGELMALFPPSGTSTAGLDGRFRVPPAALPSIPGHEIVSMLGHGGMGVVYKARHVALKRLVAIKMLLSGAYANAGERARFRREAEALAKLTCPHIVQVFDVGEFDGKPYFTMELVDGGSLADKLDNIPQPAAGSAEIIRTLADAVESAHRGGIVHRDLKPANVLLTLEGTPKITDFGLARQLEGDDFITLSGARIGTPSYMAPEQASKRWGEVGPPADIYALGAILYEMMTGRPPFRGESVADTERQLINNEPALPSQLNAGVPRDLETICLKCLQKTPGRRYASAAALAEDLGRFQRGEPILARRVGPLERAAKWARRRPAAATLVAAIVVVVALATAFGISFERVRSARRTEIALRQGRARQVIETSLALAGDLQRAERWTEAGHVLSDAATHLPDAESADLGARLALAQADQRTAIALDDVREARSGLLNPYLLMDEEYGKVFAAAGIDVEGGPEAAVGRIRASAIRQRLLAGLDDWAFMIHQNENQATGRKPFAGKLLALARRVDPDPGWRDRFRDPSVWRSADELRRLIADVPSQVPPPPAHQLAIAGGLLLAVDPNTDGISPLRDAQRRSPGDFRTNWQLGNALRVQGLPTEAVAFLRAALGLRPDNDDARGELSMALYACGNPGEAIAVVRRGLEDAPHSDRLLSFLVLELAKEGRWRESRAEYGRAVAFDPAGVARLSRALASELEDAGRHDEARDVWRAMLASGPADDDVAWRLAGNCAGDGRFAEAEPLLRRLARTFPNEGAAHFNLARALRGLKRPADALPEFRAAAALMPADFSANYELGTMLCEAEPHAGAIDALKKAAILEPKQAAPWGWMTKEQLRQFLFDDAREAATRQLDCLPDSLKPQIRRRIEICDLLAELDIRQPGLLDGTVPPPNPRVRKALAELLYRYAKRPAGAARIYETLFAAQPGFPANADPDDLHCAACSAAMAACGMGEDPAQLDPAARAHFRRRALEWLLADRAAWAQRYNEGKPGERHDAAKAMRDRLESDELAGVRDAAALAALPEDEQAQWRKFWAGTQALADRDPEARLASARAAATRRDWPAAAARYAEAFDLDPNVDSDTWFELAATRLLAGDLDGYRDIVKRMSGGDPRIRPYHVARASTLAPQSPGDVARAQEVSKEELDMYPKEFWALTERAAQLCRANRPAGVPDLVQQSLAANPKPGAAVVNWLWMAVAEQQLGDIDKARRWLDKADNWLEDQGPDMPPNADQLGLHLHNWLEAQALRRELQALIPSPSSTAPAMSHPG